MPDGELYATVKEASRRKLDERVRLVEWIRSRYPDFEKACREIAEPSRYKSLALEWFRDEMLTRCRDVANEFPEARETAYKICRAVAKDFAEMDKDEADLLRDECLRKLREEAIEKEEAERMTREAIAEAVRAEIESRVRLADWIRMRYPEPSEEVLNPSKYRKLSEAWFREELLDRCRAVAEKYGDKIISKKDIYNYCKSLAVSVAEADKLEADRLREEYMREAERRAVEERARAEELARRAAEEIEEVESRFSDIERYIEEKHGGNACWLIATHPPGWVGTVYSEWRKDVADACRAILKSYGREAYRECVDRASYIADIARSRLSELYEACRPKRRSLLARAMGW